MNKRSYDVVVAGGGTAGLGAAIAAARAGARTLLVERRGGLGGMAHSALVHTLCGLYRLRDDLSQPLEYANGGIPREFAGRLLAIGGAKPPVRMGRLDFLPHNPAAMAHLADQMTAEASGLDVFLHTEITGLVKHGAETLAGVQIFCRGRTIDIETRAVVDCTGDAEVAFMAGAECNSAPAERLQRPAYIFGIRGASPGAASGEARLRLAHTISMAVSNGRLPKEALGISFREGMLSDEVWATIDLQADPYDPCSSDCLSRVERTGRRTAFEAMEYLRENSPDFQNARIGIIPAQAGIRESRRIVGLAKLTEADILSGKESSDAAAYASWPLELRENAKGPKFRFPETNQPTAILLGCLRSRDFTNLFMAGRCISSTHGAQSSIRVTGTCLATGEAAGKAAAHFAESTQ